MPLFKNVNYLEPSPGSPYLFDIDEPPVFSSLFSEDTELFLPPDLLYAHHNPTLNLFDAFSSPFKVFNTVTDLTQIQKTPFSTYYKRTRLKSGSSFNRRSLYDRFSSLELGLDRYVEENNPSEEDTKYTWKAEITKGDNQKYKWMTEISGLEKKWFDRKHKWTAEIETPCKNGTGRRYSWMAEIKRGKKLAEENKVNMRTGTKAKQKAREAALFNREAGSAVGECSGIARQDEKKIGGCATRVVENQDPHDRRALFLRKAYAKRAAIARAKGKRKELSPAYAALMIQMSFRGYLIRRSKALRSLRELAAAKTKLKETRLAFNNYAYRQWISHDVTERQRFSERIIVLLLTVDAVEGVDLMVRAARRSMLDELEAMLEAVDPRLPKDSRWMKRRNFDLPENAVKNEITAGVAEVVQLLEQAEKDDDNAIFEVCL